MKVDICQTKWYQLFQLFSVLKMFQIVSIIHNSLFEEKLVINLE